MRRFIGVKIQKCGRCTFNRSCFVLSYSGVCCLSAEQCVIIFIIVSVKKLEISIRDYKNSSLKFEKKVCILNTFGHLIKQ